MNDNKIDLETSLSLYHYLYLTRRFEETLIHLYHSGQLRGHPHSSIGQEAIGVGAVQALLPEDMICPSLRSIGSILAKGVETKVLMCEAFRKANGPSGGKWLYHHICVPDKGVIIGSAVVAASIPTAVGVALAIKMRKTNQVVLSFFGDGATSRGDFHEALNFASVFQLPIVFICENNLYALSTPQRIQMNIVDIALRAGSYGIPGIIADGCDVFDVYKKVQLSVDDARQGKGPSLIECKTYRLRAHSEIDPEDMGRPKDELEFWRERANPVRDCKDKIIQTFGEDTAHRLSEIEKEVDSELSSAVDIAKSSPNPAPETATTKVFAEIDEVVI